MALPGLPWSLSVCYDFAIGVVTNIIAAAILDSKAPSLLDDFDKDETGNKDGKDFFRSLSPCRASRALGTKIGL